jgi:hypothetical protein
MLNEFKKFILKGNVVDLSTGVIIGAAFGAIVTAFTKGVVEPILGLFGGGPSPKLTVPIMNKMVEVAKMGADGKPVKGPDGKDVMETVCGVLCHREASQQADLHDEAGRGRRSTSRPVR